MKQLTWILPFLTFANLAINPAFANEDATEKTVIVTPGTDPTVDPSLDPSVSPGKDSGGMGLSEEFYNKFWKIDKSSNFPDGIISSESSGDGFFRSIMLKSLTGYGTGSDSDQGPVNDLYYKIAGVFACYIPQQDCEFKGITKDKHVDKVLEVKKLLESIEQCYANNVYWDDDQITTVLGKRYQTEIEKKLGIKCDFGDIDSLLTQASSIVNYPYVTPNKESATGDLSRDFKGSLQNVHTMLLSELNSSLASLIISINNHQAGSTEFKTFIDETKLDEDRARTIFNAYTDVVSAKLASFPVTIFSRSSDDVDGRVLNKGDFYALDSNKTELVKNYRKTRALQIKKLNDEYIESARSFGILKQAAISGLANIVSERFVAKGSKDSELDIIANLIKEAMTKEAKDKDKKVEPSVILKQIRDDLVLSNRLKYKQYLALERSQLALATTQMAQTNVLSDRINKIINSMVQMTQLFDAGDDFTGQIGQKAEVQKLK